MKREIEGLGECRSKEEGVRREVREKEGELRERGEEGKGMRLRLLAMEMELVREGLT